MIRRKCNALSGITYSRHSTAVRLRIRVMQKLTESEATLSRKLIIFKKGRNTLNTSKSSHSAAIDFTNLSSFCGPHPDLCRRFERMNASRKRVETNQAQANSMKFSHRYSNKRFRAILRIAPKSLKTWSGRRGSNPRRPAWELGQKL